MQCGVCEHNATDCECTHHEQSAYEKGRKEALATIARLTAELEAAQAERDEAMALFHAADKKTRAMAAGLGDPVAVHLNMLRGTIDKPTIEQIVHLYGIDALCRALAPKIVAEADETQISDQERNYLHLHTAAFNVWRWFEVARPDLIGPRAEVLRDAVMGPRPYGSAPAAIRALPVPSPADLLSRTKEGGK